MTQKKDTSQKSVITISLVTALCLIGDSMLYIALPIYYREVGLESLWEVGLILSLNRFIRIPVNPWVGLLYRKFSLRSGVLLAVLLSIITTIGYGTLNGLIAWIILRIVWGVAWSFLRLGGFFTVLDCSTDEDRGKLMGMYNGLYRLGSLIGMLVGGVLVSILGIHFVSISFGLLMIIGIPLVFWFIPSSKNDMTMETGKSTFSWITKPILKVIISGLLLAFIIQGMVSSTMSIVLTYQYGETINLYFFAIGAAALSGILQGVRWGWEPFLAIKFGQLSDGRKGRLPLFIMFLIFGAACLFLIPIELNIFLWLTIVLLFLAVSTVLTTLIDAVTSDFATQSNKNTVMTYYSVFLDIGAAFGPLISFFIIDWNNGVQIIYVLSGCILVGLAYIWYKEYRVQHRFT
ncbi:MFS transporter [Bacillus sp. JCM 19034]|uniref:MFS transporter n=1 Tax=Bacillus sp. JCM 19034 TaxID=1481928 RepID=UPI000784ED42|nr:MFS transporter [Bacillus sp. JCM 19034]